MNNYTKLSITVFLCLFLLTGAFGPAWSYVAGPTIGKWGDDPTMGTPGGMVSWSLMPTWTTFSGDGGYSGEFTAFEDFLPLGWLYQVETAFDAWSTIANIDFIEVTDDGTAFGGTSTAMGEIRLGGHVFDGTAASGTNILAHGYYPYRNQYSYYGDVHLDKDDTWKIGAGGGFDMLTVLTHEIGHAIGLGHSDVTNSLMYAGYSEGRTLQADDIAGAQYIYGLRTVVPEPLSSSLFGVGAVFFYFRKRFRKA